MLLFTHLSYGLLAFFLFYALIAESVKGLSFLYPLLLILIFILFFIQLGKEWANSNKGKTEPFLKFKSFDMLTIISLVIATFLTFYLNHTLGLGAVIASSVVGLTGGLFIKKYATSIFCGSFIGMACSIIFANPFSLLTAAIVSGIMLVLSENVLIGYGGKLGFLAFGGSYVASILFQTPFRVIPALSSDLYLLLFIYVIGAGMATFALQKELKIDAVTASALIGLLLALIHPDPTHSTVVAAYCASFTGMISVNKIRGYSEMFVLSLLTGILFISAASLFDGSGGKLGSIAFLSTVSGTSFIYYLKQINRYLFRKYEKETSKQS